MLCSYAPFGPGSSQHGWLQHDLAGVNRTRTPWLLVVLHVPWYTSNAHHPQAEGDAMRTSLEPMLLKAGVDLVFNGHVHAYERSWPVAGNERVAPGRGISHVTIGDGGNREDFAYEWVAEQPAWSALREFAYGCVPPPHHCTSTSPVCIPTRLFSPCASSIALPRTALVSWSSTGHMRRGDGCAMMTLGIRLVEGWATRPYT